MPSIKVPISVSIEVDAQELRKYLLARERMKPACFIIGASHAEHLEFGSGPAQVSSDGELQRQIELWCRRKLGLSGKELEQKTRQISAMIAKHGLKARPFWRPAVYSVSEHLQEYFDEGFNLLQICEAMQDRCNENIMWNENAPPGREIMPYNGTLQQSMYCRYLTDEEAEGALHEPVGIREVSDRIWQSREGQNKWT